ncbi:hypothetical protein GCM10023187_05310 [Nibrella viscosa]|uniref:PLAT domain-containing protein n=1 Tax=Nibrella viscosa TaxID=1084524 RepID=A0ABP8JWF2_9BACT
MQRRKRPFYIITHRSNTIKDTQDALRLGANAIELDICHHEGHYYVSHSAPLTYEGTPTVAEYLDGLSELLRTHRYNLALAIFDLKHNDFDIDDLVSVIRQHLTGDIGEGVTILLTHADDENFIKSYSGQYPNVGVGVDESNLTPAELEQIFLQAGQQNFSYADGITTFLDKPDVFANVTAAQDCAFRNEPNSFALIYTWVLMLEDSMRKYLDAYVDGIFVDPPYIEKLRNLVTAAPYDAVYELAQNGHNPYTATRLPKYKLRIKTSDTLLAGSDAFYVFTLTGTAGTLCSLPFNSNLGGRLNRDTETCIRLEGLDIGEIRSLTIEPLTSDFSSDWLPEAIVVESKWLDQPVTFVYNTDGSSEQWITKEDGAVTRLPLV